jgi:hypothetical protein
LGMNIGIILVSLFLYLFYGELKNIKQSQKTVAVVAGIGIIIFQLLPANDWFNPNPEGFSLKYISYLFQTLYCVSIYVANAKGFKYLAGRVPEQSKNFQYIMYGNILLAVFFVFMFLRAFITTGIMLPIIQIGSWFIQISAIILFFMGFILPGLKKKEATA